MSEHKHVSEFEACDGVAMCVSVCATTLEQHGEVCVFECTCVFVCMRIYVREWQVFVRNTDTYISKDALFNGHEKRPSSCSAVDSCSAISTSTRGSDSGSHCAL